MIELPGLSVPLTGETSLQPDKSISHRALIHSLLAEGESVLFNLPDSADVRSTLDCIMQCGANVQQDSGLFRIKGVGPRGVSGESVQLDAGNSGTTARLMAGVMAMQPVRSGIIGDESLSLRPMNRVILPLRQMGCSITGTESGTLPITIQPVDTYLPLLNYHLPVASAQLKASLILAALHLDEESEIIESFSTRDHSERMLGIEKVNQGGKSFFRVSRRNYPLATEYKIPGDPSSAAFLIAATLLKKGSSVTLHNVLLNPLRLTYTDVLKEWGANIEASVSGVSSNESFGALHISWSDIVPKPIPHESVPSIIDEIPILAMIAAFGEGRFCIRGASELRIKETDRIKATVHNLQAMGIAVEEYPDGFSFMCNGVKVKEAVLHSFGDHRIAMACSVAAMNLENGAQIDSLEPIKISFPDFLQKMQLLTEYKWLK